MTLMWISLGLVIVGFLAFVSGSFGFGFVCILAGGICFFVVLPLSVRKENQEKKAAEQKAAQEDEKRMWNEGYPVVPYLELGHREGYTEEWKAGYSDSTGGWDVIGCLKNITGYVINYVHLHVFPVDRIGTKIAPTECMTYTGPIKPGEMLHIRDDHKWYDLPVNDIKYEKIVVENKNGSTQVLAEPASFSVMFGRGSDFSSWKAGDREDDGSWSIRGVSRYRSSKAAQRAVLYVTPLDSYGQPVAPVATLSVRGAFTKGKTDIIWWHGMWKNMSIARLKIEKYTIEYVDGTSETAEF